MANAVVIEFIPVRQSCQLWAWKFRQRAEIETIYSYIDTPAENEGSSKESYFQKSHRRKMKVKVITPLFDYAQVLCR